MKLFNKFMYAPIGWTQDVCNGAPQMACRRNYFNNFKDVGFKLNIVSSPINLGGNMVLDFPRPFLILGYYPYTSAVMTDDPANNSGTIFGGLDIGTAALQTGYNVYLQKLFQNMQECTVDLSKNGGQQIGVSYDNSVAYNHIPAFGNFNEYFNNYTNLSLVELMENFIIPAQMIIKFWGAMASLAVDVNSIPCIELPEFCDKLAKLTDLRLWGAPGKYTINLQSGTEWMESFIELLTNADTFNTTRASFLIIEQKSIE